MAQLSQEEVKERLKNLTPEQMQELVKQQCIFCKIVAGEIPAYKIYEDNNFLAFLDANPSNAGHTLVIPNQHFSVLPQLPDNLAAALLVLVKRLASTIFETTKAEGITILQRNGQVAGQVVSHVHFHIIPRYTDDKIQDSWEPRKLTEEQFKDVQQKIVKTLKAPAKPIETKPREEVKEEQKKPKLFRVKSKLP